MARQNPSYEDDERERHEAAVRRLEALLKDAGPGIIVRPAGARDFDTETDAVEHAIQPSPQSLTGSDGQSPRRAKIKNSAAAEPSPADAPQSRSEPTSRRPRRPAEPIAVDPDQLRHLPQNVRSRLEKLAVASPPEPKAAARALAPERVRQAAPIPATGKGELWDAIAASRRPFMATGLFSLIINLLMLTGPLFMLQVYDRVMSSGSIPTLVGLTVLTTALYAIVGALELVRSRIIVRIGTEVDGRLADRVFRASLRRSLLTTAPSATALRELDSLRNFLGGQGPLTFFDAPWTPIYLLVIFMVHWTLGVAATLGAALLLGLAWVSETRSRAPLLEAGKAAGQSLELAETGQRNAEALVSMGMASAYRARWHTANDESLGWQVRAADKLGGMSALSKSLRLLLQSLMLALGAALALTGDISAGSIIAATIIFGRALAPVEQAIGHWRSYLKARESYDKLYELLAGEPEPPHRMALPTPKGHLTVEGLRVASPDTRNLILSGISFFVEPGQMLAVIGPSASGKSTLVRSLVNLWPPFSGSIKLDGARLDQWDPEALGQHIGYLPQNVGLFAGTVKENIARFKDDASDAEIIEAAKQAHAHELILLLPQGYDTQLGAFGAYLSAGQRQRIALARALFRNPALVVLDEPNSNLDRAGDEALSSAIDGMRSRGQAVVLVSHRVQAIGKADLLLYLEKGTQRAFGPRREVMKMFQGPAPDTQHSSAAAAAAAGVKTVKTGQSGAPKP